MGNEVRVVNGRTDGHLIQMRGSVHNQSTNIQIPNTRETSNLKHQSAVGRFGVFATINY